MDRLGPGSGAPLGIDSRTLSRRLRSLATPGPYAARAEARITSRRRSVGWIRSCSDGRGFEAGFDFAGHRSSKVEWNRSHPTDTTTLSQLQNTLPESEQRARSRGGSFVHGRARLRL